MGETGNTCNFTGNIRSPNCCDSYRTCSDADIEYEITCLEN
jgi:hypothetical protein